MDGVAIFTIVVAVFAFILLFWLFYKLFCGDKED